MLLEYQAFTGLLKVAGFDLIKINTGADPLRIPFQCIFPCKFIFLNQCFNPLTLDVDIFPFSLFSVNLFQDVTFRTIQTLNFEL